jgi:hypothetical protein
MSKLAPQTKSFIIIFCIAVVGTYLCLTLWWLLNSGSGNRIYSGYSTIPYAANSAQPAAQPAPVLPVNTSAWKTYSNSDYHLSFAYDPAWKVLPVTQQKEFSVLQIDPGPTHFNIKIYISPKGFYLMDSLPAKSETIGGQAALNVNNTLYGIKANNLYYTFDVGLSMGLLPEFDALVHSVKFQ